MPYRMLSAFESLFRDKPFLHRRPNQGDAIAAELYEDLFELSRSKSYVAGVRSKILGVNGGNKIVGREARRGDGTFGEFVPNSEVLVVPDFNVARGHLANLQIGTETKIFSTALGKQQRERVGDLNDQANTFHRHNAQALRVAIVGLNHAPHYAAYEGDRITRTDGKKYKHPIQEASKMAALLLNEVAPHYDEFLLLEYEATNENPFPFSWLNHAKTEREYGAALIRLSVEFEKRFR